VVKDEGEHRFRQKGLKFDLATRRKEA